MTTKMKAPEFSGGASCEGTTYDLDAEGCITVENGLHVPMLEAHGFVTITGGAVASTPPPPSLDDPGECPDFAKFANRGEIVTWLAANGVVVSGDTARGDLEAQAVSLHAELAETFAAQGA